MTDFRDIIAEPPYDEMGAEFREIFGRWVNETELTHPNQLEQLAFGLFRLRLDLARKYKTFFAAQVTANETASLWRARFRGEGNEPCYSFAIKDLPRTARFWKWAMEALHDGVNFKHATSYRTWDTSYAKHPTFPVPVTPLNDMAVWSHKYQPRFGARDGGAFECRVILYGCTGELYTDSAMPVFLFEHPRSRWIKQIRAEAMTFWNIAWDKNNDHHARYAALASFEWLWVWANPFMRSGALTADALSLVMQKHIDGCKMRNQFYHQDCEALLLSFDDYVEKRVKDMTYMWAPRFDMKA